MSWRPEQGGGGEPGGGEQRGDEHPGPGPLDRPEGTRAQQDPDEKQDHGREPGAGGDAIEGIAQRRVFQEFRRGSNVAAAKSHGFGIGLAVVKELVERYHGRIELQSEVGQGTTFLVEFPPGQE